MTRPAPIPVYRAASLLLLLLLIACSSGATETPSATLPASATVAWTATSTPTPTASPPPVPTATPSPTIPSAVEYTVQPGDTLYGLALTYGVPIAAIQLANGLGDSTILHAGNVLTIPSPAEWEGASLFWVVYVVQPGDTLSGIAARYGLQLAELQSANQMSDGDILRAGQALVLPLDRPAAVAQVSPTQPPRPAPTSPPSPTDAAASTESTPPPTPVPANPPPADVAAWPYEVARIINEVRAQHGLPPLTYNETLARAAQGQANDCSQRGWCSHTGSDGSDIKTRILRAGYTPASWAECWAQSRSPQGAVDMWMDEVPPNDPHRRTLLTTWLTEIGLGVAEARGGYYYFVANFGRP